MTAVALPLPLPKRRREVGSPAALLVLPLLVYFGVFVLLPQLVLLAISLRGLSGPLTIEHFARALTDPFTFAVLGRTLRLGVYVTAATLVLAFPYALCMATARPRLRSVMLLLVVLPMLMSAVVRTFGWLVTLGMQGPVNAAIVGLGLSEEPVQIMFTEIAVVIGLIQIELPMMVLALATALFRLDPNLMLASCSLGAGRWRTFVRVVLPLSVPGTIAGCALVFASSAGAFVTQTILGGGKLLYMPMYIYQQSVLSQQWAFAAVLAILLMASVGAIVFAATALARRSRGFIHG